ncbi:MAG TPA: FAD-containing oxidoreductase, partial [Terriglobia bacterium]|nr:FAD-containing oxidoreductase [Terriglobia bacterium]
MTQHFDGIVIGTGQAGPSLAARLAGAGMKMAVLERGRFGGTCVNTGCIPTKTLVASAYAANLARRASDFGVVADGPVHVDMKRVIERRDAISGHSRDGIERWMKGLPNCTVFEGHGRFESPRSIRVNGELLEAEKIFVNVGGRAAIPPIQGLDQVPFLTNSSMMNLADLPPHLLIVGGSYVGLEFAQIYRRFGSEVTIIEMGPRLIAREDMDVSDAIREVLEREGIRIRLNAKCISARMHDRQILAGVDCEEEPSTVSGSHLLIATGRRPNTGDLGLEKAGVITDERGYIRVDEQLRTNVPGIWALGDCNGRGAFTHTAYNDFEIVAGNLLDQADRRVTDRILAYALFIDPPLGRCGLTETEILKSGRRVLTAKRPMSRVSRAIEKGETQGFMKVTVDAESRRILGAAILGTGGDEAIHCILDVMYAGAPYD